MLKRKTLNEKILMISQGKILWLIRSRNTVLNARLNTARNSVRTDIPPI